MTVSELIELLKTHRGDLRVVVPLYSEQLLLTPEMVVVEGLCEARQDGWVHHARPDKPKVDYLVIGQ